MDQSAQKKAMAVATAGSNDGSGLKRKRDSDVLLPPMLPSQRGMYTLVIDMDGTIVADFDTCPSCHIDFIVEHITTGKRAFISKRPGLENFLLQSAELCEIVVFTERRKQCADVILDHMRENRFCISHLLYRDSCTEIKGKLVKDLSLLGRDLDKVIIVDDCPFAYALQPNNAIPGVTWYNGDQSDKVLETIFANIKDRVEKKYDMVLNMATAPLLPHSLRVLKTLVLDMDGTILNERDTPLTPRDEGSQFFPVMETRYGGVQNKKYIYMRPGLDRFLREMSEVFEIVVFTASCESRADYYLDQIDRDKRISFRLYRDSCYTGIRGKWIKDLSRIGRDLRRVVIIDDKPVSYEFQQDNAIPIKPFDGRKSDSELTDLIPFLRRLSREKDVRNTLLKI